MENAAAEVSGFNQVGFLGNDLGGWEAQVQREFPEAFGIADRMNRIGMRMVHAMPDGERSEAEILALTAFYRGLQSFQSTILLAQLGAMAEARTLARLCCEAAIVAGGLLKVEGTLEKLHEDHAKHSLAMANSMIELNRQAGANADMTRFETEVARVNLEYPRGPQSLRYNSLAHQAGLGSLYELAYRLPSGDGAHITLGALHRHVDKNGEDEFVGMIFHPDKSDLGATLLAANAALLHLLGLAQEYMGLNAFEAEMRDLLLQWQVTRDVLEGRA
ncbi:DUF5677 domain-containing protein [Ralstonia mojiangensis]|uniref:DUF5677 domain-containing protein n=1 Tax=Ralstonia mojiangensis TaxID=2953895 RepID=UPI00209022E3|nr:DUF5677 domain-containing protein [Ralstonia mojiangensis]MCO5412827.1 DUF5677 domain-containing protein [Ralstonia mojiangensis]